MNKAEDAARSKIHVGVSACLLGQEVRYDGGHTRNRYVTDVLGRWFQWVPVCPEVEFGLPTPRPPMRLEGDPAAPRLVVTSTGEDLTEGMRRFAARRARALEREGPALCGFIFKSKSPSSGMARVKVYGAKGIPVNKGSGLFARAVMDRFPNLPVEEEGRLNDPGLRENFLERVFTCHRWQQLNEQRPTVGRLVAFHTRHKLLLMSHSPRHYRELGRLVAAGKQARPRELYSRYERGLMAALRLRATAAKQVNVLQHMMGYFKRDLTGDEKAELLEQFQRYRHGLTPLIVPLTLINHYVRKYRQPYLAEQVYLNPHPAELKLRNHV